MYSAPLCEVEITLTRATKPLFTTLHSTVDLQVLSIPKRRGWSCD
jgi:hypothetical protein